MIRNYFKIAFRNLVRNKVYSFINIMGLAVGMGVAMLIGLWINDELSFNKSFANYSKLGQTYMNQTINGQVGSQMSMAHPLGKELREKYADFKDVAMADWGNTHIIAYKDAKFSRVGLHVEPQFTRMFSLKMVKGVQDGLQEINSVMITESLAQSLFGIEDPIGKIVKTDNKSDLKVTGVFEDFPNNSDFATVDMLTPWAYYMSQERWVKNSADRWNDNSFQCFIQLNEKADFEQVSAKIKNIVLNKRNKEDRHSKPELFLHPMSKWHLYSEFKNGFNVGGRIQFVWLFSAIGIFVLLLACINFMNLSTARSEKRAKEVGIRKAIGSVRSQLVNQFLSESMLVVLLAFFIAIALANTSLPWFNELASKKMTMLWTNPVFWIISLAFVVVTGLLAGSYPALYLSSFEPVRVLKGTFKVGKFASIPRKVLVVVQFTVSITLIIGTIIVYNQIQYAKNRPIGYDRNGLIYIDMNTPDLYGKYDVIKNDLLNTGVVENMAESSSPMTGVWADNFGFSWEGMEPNLNPLFGTIACTHDLGNTVGFQFKEGRDFSREFNTDSSAIILNESAAKMISPTKTGLVDKIITWNGRKYHVVGVIKDMVMQSPYAPILPTVFLLDYEWANVITIKLKPSLSANEAISKVEAVFKKHNPGSPFDYKFIDQEFGQKFAAEERIGKLASFFAALAIFISCLGLFGLASFVAEQRTKEIGIRKVLGATVTNLWTLLSRDFVLLVIISCLIAIPIAYYFLNDWLQKYEYRTGISWWIFAVSGGGALAVTLLTVSFQAIKAALMNPIKSLKSE
ncbi:ABC transporter permease [Emticicia sp. BO119]|uniref:ABC transporter permease n=1 Tax=Emticicia sp. BO119 TaxID=2757768 RepID=UPI0015F0B86E|nr:ABC transporter permease [Emticicia sp. BO119]MBA4850860.1 ABC transporter permease [Emticicia sp. BO119]